MAIVILPIPRWFVKRPGFANRSSGSRPSSARSRSRPAFFVAIEPVAAKALQHVHARVRSFFVTSGGGPLYRARARTMRASRPKREERTMLHNQVTNSHQDESVFEAESSVEAEPSFEPTTDARNFAHAAHRNLKVRFEGGEHTFIGDRITLQFEAGPQAAARHPIYRGGSYQGQGNQSDPRYRARSFRYGQVIALGGDFYGDPLRPISTDNDPQAAFRAAYLTFQREVDGEIDQILKIMQREIDAIAAAIRAGKPPSSAS